MSFMGRIGLAMARGNQFLVTTCRQEAKFGTITTHNEKQFFRWADPFPRTLKDLDHGSSSPNDQQRLVAGMLDHLLEGNHTPRFWNIVRAKAPSTEKARAWLKEHGQILEEEV
jgi:hypothetical protein